MSNEEIIAGCIGCGEDVRTDSYYALQFGDAITLCPTCRRRCEIGKRVDGMEFRSLDVTQAMKIINQTWNQCLKEAKGEV